MSELVSEFRERISRYVKKQRMKGLVKRLIEAEKKRLGLQSHPSSRYERMGAEIREMDRKLEQAFESKLPDIEPLTPSLEDSYFSPVVGWEVSECGESYMENYRMLQRFFASHEREDRHYAVWMLVLKHIDRFVGFRARAYGVLNTRTVDEGRRSAEAVVNMYLETNAIPADVLGEIKPDIVNDSPFARSFQIFRS